MDSGPVLFLAKLFLCHYDSRWINYPQKKYLTKVRKLRDIFGFIDGLNAISDAGIFESNFGIYTQKN